MEHATFYTAQICENGHVITPWVENYPGIEQRFCSKCGSKTLMACPACARPVRGLSHYRLSDEYTRPAYCADCGSAFPWTVSAIQAVNELAIHLNMEEKDRTELPDLIENLVRETPRTTLAAIRLKGLLQKTGPVAIEGFKQILIGVITEGAKRMVWPSS